MKRETFVEAGAAERAKGAPDAPAESAFDLAPADVARLQSQSLALQTAGLGLWEWQVDSGAFSVDMFWAMTLGYAVAEFVPHIETLRAIEHPDDRSAIVKQISPCLRGEASEYTGEHRLRHRAGHWIWVLEHGIVIERDGAGKPRRVIGTSQDITERKAAQAALQHSQRSMALALQSAQLGRWEHDVVTGRFIFDERFTEIVGYTLAELTPGTIQTWDLFEHPADLALRAQRRARMAELIAGTSDSYVSEHRMRHKRGHDVWVRGTGVAVERNGRGQALKIVGLWQDMTARRRTEEELRIAKETADAANHAKSQFLANMSHEIRTPMNAMIGLTRLVLEGDLSARQRDFLQKVLGSSKSLLAILNDILDYSKIEAGRMTLEAIEFPIEQALTGVADLFGAQLEQKGLELFFEVAPDVPLHVIGDPLRLSQVLNNLVGNAIKFTDAGEIRIRAELAERAVQDAGCVLRFAVSDTGIGLSPEQAGKLFRAFTQADESVTRKYGGTGLGLTISQQLVELMGGTIGVESTPGAGCTFTFSARFMPAASPAAALDIHRLRGLRTLVVDDQETSRVILARLFEAWGLEADTVASAAAGLERIACSRRLGRPYDVVLLDWRMPEMDGVEMARRMRAQALAAAASEECAGAAPAPCPPFAIMVTAYGRDELASVAADLPLDIVLTKPVVPSALFDILMQLRQGAGGAADPARPQAPPPARRIDGARVLLVEDNLLNQEVAREFLHGLGVAVTIAGNGAIALDCLAREAFDLVLMDMHMPVLDGISATERIQALPADARPPVVAMTAAVLSEDRARCERAGMVDFVAKPVDPDELVRVLRRWLPARCVDAGQGAATAALAPARHLPAPAAADALPAFDGFDGGAALRRLHGRSDHLWRLLRSFAHEQRDAAARLEAQLARGDAQGARHALHALKGSAATLGLTAIAAEARALEARLGGSAGNEVGAPSFARLAERLGEAIGVIESSAAPSPVSGQPLLTLDPATVTQFVNSLRRYVLEQELMPDDLLDELKRMAETQGPASALAALQQHIFEFDHAAALADIERITGVQEPEE